MTSSLTSSSHATIFWWGEMQSLILWAALLAVARCRVLENCSGISIHGINHEKEVLKENIDSPYQLAIDYDTSYLFFSFNTPHDLNDGFKSGYINLKTNEFGIIRGITGGFANAVDGKSHTVYLGGNDGIYKFDFDTKRAVFVGEKDTSIWQLFFKDKLYFTDYPNEKAYVFEDGTGRFLKELRGTKAQLLALDRNDNIFFANSSGLFVYKKEKSKITFLGDYNLNSFTADMNQNLYFSTAEGIYSIDENGPEVKELALIENGFGMAIDTDNSIIYANTNSIIRLKPTKDVCLNFRNNNKLD